MSIETPQGSSEKDNTLMSRREFLRGLVIAGVAGGVGTEQLFAKESHESVEDLLKSVEQDIRDAKELFADIISVMTKSQEIFQTQEYYRLDEISKAYLKKYLEQCNALIEKLSVTRQQFDTVLDGMPRQEYVYRELGFEDHPNVKLIKAFNELEGVMGTFPLVRSILTEALQ